MPTNIPWGDVKAIRKQSAGLFTACMQRQTNLGRLSGPLPKQSDAENKLRFQSSNDMPVVTCMDLAKNRGDEVEFDYIQALSGYPIMGSEIAAGQGKSLAWDNGRLRINQARYPIDAGNAMSRQRTVHDLRKLCRALGYNYMTRYQDQRILVHAAGARGFANDIEWAIPLASHSKFADVMVNTVVAPSHNRHFMSTGSGMEGIAASGNEITIATTDVMNTNLVDDIATKVDGMPLPPPSVVFKDDKLAYDNPTRVLLVSSEQYNSFLQSGSFRTWQSNAMARSRMAKDNPLFMGDAGLWRGILIVKMPKPIRFYAGDALNWCASATSATETTTDLVPAAFGTTHAVDRAILLGGQSVAMAFGKTKNTQNPFFWAEELSDFDDKEEIMVGDMAGVSKIRFDIDHGQQIEPTDLGIMCIDTSVRLSA